MDETLSPTGVILEVLGDLELSGRIRPVRSVHAAVVTAKANGITKVIVPEENAAEVINPVEDEENEGIIEG